MRKSIYSYGRFSALLTLLLLIHGHLSAQSLTSPGYVITVAGDSIRGLITEGSDFDLERRVMFSAGSVTPTYYSPDQLKGFGFDYGRRFKSFRIPGEGKDSLFVFAKHALGGKINFYSWGRSKKGEPDIFLVNNLSNEMAHLVKEEGTSRTDEYTGKQTLSESKTFVGQMAILKNDGSGFVPQSHDLRYTEGGIQKDIREYNQNFVNKFSTWEYQQQKSHRFYGSGGVMTLGSNGYTGFRLALYRETIFPERASTWSIYRGISYSDVSSPRPDTNPMVNSSQNYKNQILSILPIGLRFYSKNPTVKPYIYGSGGVAFLIDTHINVVNFNDLGDNKRLRILPVLNLGAGLAIKANKGFVFMEVTPTVYYGLFVNFGFTF